MKFFYYITGVCLFVQFIVHILSIVGIYIDDSSLFIWILNICTLLLGIPPAIEVQKQYSMLKRFGQIKWDENSFEVVMLRMTAKPFLILTGILLVNIFVCFLMMPQGKLVEIDDKFVLMYKNEVVRELSNSEYWKLKANKLRIMTAGWMFFLSSFMGVLYSSDKKWYEKL